MVFAAYLPTNEGWMTYRFPTEQVEQEIEEHGDQR